MKCVYVYNKIDVVGIDDVDKLACQPNSIVISCNLKLNLDRLLTKLWDEMGLVGVYSKPQGKQPDFVDPFVLSASLWKMQKNYVALSALLTKKLRRKRGKEVVISNHIQRALIEFLTEKRRLCISFTEWLLRVIDISSPANGWKH